MYSNQSRRLTLRALHSCSILLLVIYGVLSQTPDMNSSPDPSNDLPTEPVLDLTSVSWAHAVNSKQQLLDTIANDSVRFIESDILLGILDHGDDTKPMPIMAHPPANTSDISLKEYLEIVKNELPSDRGIKLDFKSTEAFEASMDILTDFFNEVEGDIPVILNADILAGPGARNNKGVNATVFLSSIPQRFSVVTVSPGWTTKVDSSDNKYTSEDIDMMTELLNKNCIIQPVSFPVRASIAANSVDELKTLIISSTEKTTLTIWSPKNETVNLDNIRKLIAEVGKDKIYLDLPPEMLEELRNPQTTTPPPASTAEPSTGISSTTVIIIAAVVIVGVLFIISLLVLKKKHSR